MAVKTPTAEAPRRSRVPLLLFLLALAVLAAAIGRAYHQRADRAAPAEVPLLRAEPGPARERPAEPGGMTVPYRDLTVLHEVGVPRDESARPVVERLLPPPEEPLPKPGMPGPAAAAAGAEAGNERAVSDAAVGAAAAGMEAGNEAAASEAAPAAGAEAENERTASEEPAVAEAGETEAADPAAGAGESAAPADAGGAARDPIDAALALAPPAPAPVPVGPGFPVQLGAWRTRAEAAEGWEAARARAADALGPIDHFVVEAASGGDVFYRLQVGPMPSRDSAASLCRQLLARGVACFVAAP